MLFLDLRDGLAAIHHIPGVGWNTMARLLKAGFLPDQDLTPSVIDALRHNGISPKMVKLLKQKWNPAWIKQVKEGLKNKKIEVITYFCDEYPLLLKEIAMPPWVLYIKGNAGLLRETSLAVVGTRRPTPYGLKVTKQLVREMVEAGFVIASGMANGIDGAAHRTALEHRGKTVAVLGCGADVVYPKNHRALYDEIVRTGTVVSESIPGTTPHPGLFPARNRIISGLSRGTLVIEAAERSGSLITADFSLEQGREVFAVPGPITSVQSRGTLQLIRQGAKCVVCGNDILEEFYDWTPGKQKQAEAHDRQKQDFDEKEEKILSYFDTDEPVPLPLLLEKGGREFPPGEIQRILLQLELKKAVLQLPGARFVRNSFDRS
jgi:DNA processing protein